MLFTVRKQKGFTLIELLVSISIFAIVSTLCIVLFNQVLKIQRRIEVQRRASQSIRTISEFIVKEVRNGKIDYGVQDGATVKSQYPSQCPQVPQSGGVPSGGPTYTWNDPNRNNGLALVNINGESECIYYQSSQKTLFLQKLNVSQPQRLSPQDITVDRFEVRVSPSRDPYMDIPTGSGLVEVQPMAQILMTLTATLPSGESKTVSYQTSISTNIYDIPRQ